MQDLAAEVLRQATRHTSARGALTLEGPIVSCDDGEMPFDGERLRVRRDPCLRLYHLERCYVEYDPAFDEYESGGEWVRLITLDDADAAVDCLLPCRGRKTRAVLVLRAGGTRVASFGGDERFRAVRALVHVV